MLEPWLFGTERKLLDLLGSGRLPHALILSGTQGIGLQQISQSLIAAALCQNPASDGSACGECKSCRLRVLGNHEDYHELSVPDERASIGVEQVRQLCPRLYTTPQRAPRQVAYIRAPELMTPAASNALLKTLEEPPVRTLLLLETHALRSLLPTIRSRAVAVEVAVPELSIARSWLQQRFPAVSAGEIDLALLLSGDAPFAAAGNLEPSNRALHAERIARLHSALFEPTGVLRWLRSERAQVSLVRALLIRLLAPDPWSTQRQLPVHAAAIVGLTQQLNSSSLYRANAALWRAQAQSGSGLREDLQLMQIMSSLRPIQSSA